jgi:hypothetical protein
VVALNIDREALKRVMGLGTKVIYGNVLEEGK